MSRPAISGLVQGEGRSSADDNGCLISGNILPLPAKDVQSGRLPLRQQSQAKRSLGARRPDPPRRNHVARRNGRRVPRRAEAPSHGAGYRVHDCRPHATPVKGDQFSVSGRQNRAMTSPLRKKLVDAIIASGCDDPEEAGKLAATPADDLTWTVEVLNSGKVDEQRLPKTGRLFNTPVETLNIQGGPAGLGACRAASSSSTTSCRSAKVTRRCGWPLTTASTPSPAASPPSFRTARKSNGCSARGRRSCARSRRFTASARRPSRSFSRPHRASRRSRKRRAMDLNADDPEASVVKFVNQIIREALFERATDIHVEPLENDLRIRYRIDGILHEVAVPPQLRMLQSAIISRLKVMAHMDIAEKRLPQDGRINLQPGGEPPSMCASPRSRPSTAKASPCGCSTATDQQFGFERLDLATASPHRPQLLRSRTASFWSPGRPAQENRPRSIPSFEHQLRPAAHHHHRGAGRIPARGRLADRRQTGDRPDVRQRPPPFCARTRTSSWSAKFATSRPRKSPSAPP